jgi:hypothetical protein
MSSLIVFEKNKESLLQIHGNAFECENASARIPMSANHIVRVEKEAPLTLHMPALQPKHAHVEHGQSPVGLCWSADVAAGLIRAKLPAVIYVRVQGAVCGVCFSMHRLRVG